MKAALGTIPDKYVYSAYLGESPLASIYQGTTKIWPDNAQRVTRMTLDVASLDGTLNGIYWQLALDAVDTGCTASKFIRFTCDRTYNVNHTYGSYPLVYHMGNGEFSFLNEQGPLAVTSMLGTRWQSSSLYPAATVSAQAASKTPPSATTILPASPAQWPEATSIKGGKKSVQECVLPSPACLPIKPCWMFTSSKTDMSGEAVTGNTVPSVTFQEKQECALPSLRTSLWAEPGAVTSAIPPTALPYISKSSV